MDKPNKPTFTQIPNDFLDNSITSLSGSALRVYLIVARQTFGWIEDRSTGRRKEKDWLTYEQLMDKTGVQQNSVARAIKELEEVNLLEVLFENGSPAPRGKRERKKLFYRINTSATKSGADEATATKNVVEIAATKSVAPLLQKGENTKENKRNLENKNNINIIDNVNNVSTVGNVSNTNNLNIRKSREYLLSIPQEDLEELEASIGVKKDRMLKEADRAYTWLESKDKRYKNYKAFFRNWIRNVADREGIVPSGEKYTERQLYLRDLFARVALKKPGANEEADKLIGEDRIYFIKLFWGMVDS